MSDAHAIHPLEEGLSDEREARPDVAGRPGFRPSPPAPPGPRRGDRIASWVPSREVVYESIDDRGEARLYSGRVYLPPPGFRRRPMPVPLVLFVHGTQAETDEIPLFNRGAEAMVGALAALVHGFAVAMPDLPGYGKDASPRPHPYCHAKSLAFSVLDMIRPALALLDEGPLAWDGRIFLVGYSSGGYGAMAAVKEAHTNPRYQDLALTAAACMGGPFHLSETIHAYHRDGADYLRPDLQAFLFHAYHDLYPETGVFAPDRTLNPHLLESRNDGLDRGTIGDWLVGAYGGSVLCQKIKFRLTGTAHGSTTAKAVMNPQWVDDQLLSPAWPDTAVGRLLQENDLVGGWHPRVPMLLAVSPRDEFVPCHNTYAILEDWRRRGCTAPVELLPLTLLGFGLDHCTAGALALHKAFTWFKRRPWEREACQAAAGPPPS